MTVKELLTSDVQSCRPDTDLAAVARILWDRDCGVVPVADDEGRVIGMITDRDICIAAATRNELPSDIRAHALLSGDPVYSCAPEDDVRTALALMKSQRVRRLPVLDERGRLAGIVSMNDVVMHASCRADAEVPGHEFLETMQAICAHPVGV